MSKGKARSVTSHHQGLRPSLLECRLNGMHHSHPEIPVNLQAAPGGFRPSGSGLVSVQFQVGHLTEPFQPFQHVIHQHCVQRCRLSWR